VERAQIVTLASYTARADGADIDPSPMVWGVRTGSSSHCFIMNKSAEESSAVTVPPSKPRLWQVLGPGLITGAADDDPSGIATYAQAGAHFGFRMCWTMVLTYPLMVAIQAISARIGRTTGRGIAGNIREFYPNWLLQGIVTLLFAANSLNIGADLGAMAEAARLLLPHFPGWLFVCAFGGICTACQVFLQHTRYVAILKWLTLSLLTYVAALFVVQIPWREAALGLLVPRLTIDRDFWLMVVAILGTTVSPYLFFWQAAQEVEDTKAKPTREPLLERPSQAPHALARIRLDTSIGMGISNLIALAIMITSAATLHADGHHSLSSAAEAAEALRPIAGEAAFGLFAIGIIGTGLLAVPVLAGSAAYALGEARRWPVGLSRQPLQAKAFYVAIAGATVLGAAANVLEINPVTALVWSAVINGIVAVPVMVLLMLMATREDIMGEFRLSTRLSAVGWAATVIMLFAGSALLVSFI
jgi:NRAMP (natural resistance-associated macrophage protein)-like metal ion transporter